MWHEATVFIFLRKFLLLAFKHGVQGQADDFRVGKRTHTQEISPRILKIGSLPIAPPPQCPQRPRVPLPTGPAWRAQSSDGGGEPVGKVWCVVALFRHSLV